MAAAWSIVRRLMVTMSVAAAVGLGMVTVPAWGQAPPGAADLAGALDAYVKKPDDAYAWSVEKTFPGNPSQTFVIKLTSQSWRSPAEVDRPVWQHWLTVVKPTQLKTDKLFLLVSGGANDRPAPDKPNQVIAQIAQATGSMVAELRMIPNQPLVFHGDGVPRKEDDLIAYCWDQFLDTGDPTWLPRLPMVKSVVKAMDCLQEWSRQEQAPISRFVVAGGSKRGWTTWMAGVADERVEAIVPIVIDVLNVDESIRHHGAAYGFWAKALGNYVQHGIVQRPDHPRMQDLHRVEDPYSYLDRLTLPKYIVNGSGDQFFLPDSSRFYYHDLEGEKHIRYVPNTDHGVDGSLDAVTSIVAFYQMLIAGKPRPDPAWTFEADGSIRVTSPVAPQMVTLWQAHNPTARDFRVDTIGKTWTSTPLEAAADGSWVGRPKRAEKGWTAAFVELAYDSGGLFPFKVSTAVRVTPDTLPFDGLDQKQLPWEGEPGFVRPVPPATAGAE
ncbi:MAG: PhoPQ-activated pathogenicity [Planctomycetia bacterium]|nr:PhoPQ-activated pathogenicity [Planctomycetia bacterium]